MIIVDQQDIDRLEELYHNQKTALQESTFHSFYSNCHRIIRGIRYGVIANHIAQTYENFILFLMKDVDQNFTFSELKWGLFLQPGNKINFQKPFLKVTDYHFDRNIKLDFFNTSFFMSKEIKFKERRLNKKNRTYSTKIEFQITLYLIQPPANPIIRKDYIRFIKSNIDAFDLQILQANIAFGKITDKQKIKITKQIKSLERKMQRKARFVHLMQR